MTAEVEERKSLAEEEKDQEVGLLCGDWVLLRIVKAF
jgi:hypothetical protein